MMRALEAWSSVQTRPSAKEIARRLAVSLPLVESPQPVDIPDFMGDWFVLANIPTPLEVGTSNNIEHYDYDEQNKRVQVTFTYVPGGTPTAKPAQAFMRGYIKNAPLNTRWSLDVKIGFYWPLGLTYLIPYICNDYVIVSVPDRSYLWIMTRGRPLPPNTTMPDEATAKGVTYLSQEEQDRVYQLAFAKAIELGFNADKIVRVPWTSL